MSGSTVSTSGPTRTPCSSASAAAICAPTIRSPCAWATAGKAPPDTGCRPIAKRASSSRRRSMRLRPMNSPSCRSSRRLRWCRDRPRIGRRSGHRSQPSASGSAWPSSPRTRGATRRAYPGGTYQHLFYVADVQASGPALDGELHADLEEADFLAVFPLAGKGRARLIGTVRGERAKQADTLKFEDVSRRIIDNLKIEIEKVNWFSTYRVHHRVTKNFRKGRAFLLGDAAHIHSPAGGQGMNTGIGDAINLAWKLQTVLAGCAPGALLDSYEAERIAFARRLVKTTDRVFMLVTAEGKIADIIRTRLAPTIFPVLVKFGVFREFMFRTVSQIMINYRHCALNEGRAGAVHGGDRLPWVIAGDVDNYEPLKAMIWQVHVYGGASPELKRWCQERGLPLYVFAWRPEYAKAGFAQDALYLIRPDTYVALAQRAGAVDSLRRYFEQRGIRVETLGRTQKHAA